MKYIVSYPKEYSSNGTLYNQRIRISLTDETIINKNKFIQAKRYSLRSKENPKEHEKDYLLYVEDLHKGKNYLTLTGLRNFVCLFGLYHRVRLDRNTVLIIQ